MLADHGLAMQAVLDLALLPSWATDPLVAAGVSPDRYSRMVMLGQAGTRLWDTMEAAGFDSLVVPCGASLGRLVPWEKSTGIGRSRWPTTTDPGWPRSVPTSSH